VQTSATPEEDPERWRGRDTWTGCNERSSVPDRAAGGNGKAPAGKLPTGAQDYASSAVVHGQWIAPSSVEATPPATLTVQLLIVLEIDEFVALTT
jgi:hypothetical protein